MKNVEAEEGEGRNGRQSNMTSFWTDSSFISLSKQIKVKLVDQL